MKWFKYLRRTPLAQIRADWAQYMRLRRQCASLRDARNTAYSHIVTIVSGEDQRKHEPSCICQQYYTASSFRPNISCDSLTDNMVWIRYSVCRRFDENNDTEKCTKLDCPGVLDNHKYVDACVRLNVMCQARRDFWRVKFAQACQNVK